MLGSITYVFLFAAGVRLLAPVAHRRLGYTPVDPAEDPVRMVASVDELPFLSGKRALIVGGTKGIGQGIAVQLAAAGVHVSIAGRSEGQQTLALMRARARPGQQFNVYRADLSSLDGCARLVEKITRAGRAMDYLIFTVGLWPDLRDPLNAAGVDKVVAVDVQARVVILDALNRQGLLTDGVAVLSVLASGKAVAVPPVSFLKDVMSGESSPALHQFFAVGPVLDAALTQAAGQPEYSHVQIIGTCPGVVSTDLLYNSGLLPQWVSWALFAAARAAGVAISPEESGLRHAALLNAASAGRINRRPAFFDHELVPRLPHPLVEDAEFSAWLWAHLVSLVPALSRRGDNNIVPPESVHDEQQQI